MCSRCGLPTDIPWRRPARNTHRDSLTGLVAEHGALSAALFVLAYVAAVSLSLPGAVILTLALWSRRSPSTPIPD